MYSLFIGYYYKLSCSILLYPVNIYIDLLMVVDRWTRELIFGDAAAMSNFYPISELLILPSALTVVICGPHVQVLDSKYASRLELQPRV